MKKVTLVFLVWATAAATPAIAQKTKPVKPAPPSANYDELFEKYLSLARNQPATPADPGGLWMNGLFADLRARRVNDLVTVRVDENVSAAGSADSNLDKASKASVGVPNLFGLETKYPGALDPQALATLSANTTFKGAGATTRQGTLTAVVTARVAEVMANGDLAIEGIREIDINGDRQIIVLTGVVRTADIGAGNVVPSTAVGQMRIRYFGQGLMKDNLNPGWLVRVLNKVF